MTGGLPLTPSDVPSIAKTKHPASVMMLGVVGSDGKKIPPHWFKQGLRLGAKDYLEVMKKVIKPWVDQNYPRKAIVWQQDSIPAHKAKVMQKWCHNSFTHFWLASFWPPNIPDLYSCDYSIWSVVESRACAPPTHT